MKVGDERKEHSSYEREGVMGKSKGGNGKKHRKQSARAENAKWSNETKREDDTDGKNSKISLFAIERNRNDVEAERERER